LHKKWKYAFKILALRQSDVSSNSCKKLKAEMLNRVLAMAGWKVGPSTGG
jgi:hypothetical protein